MPDGELPDDELPDGELPDGQMPDGPVPDGPMLDGPLPDHPLPDVPIQDAGPEPDVPADVEPDGPPDAELVDGCEPADELCDLLDNDCDGRVDEDDVCADPLIPFCAARAQRTLDVVCEGYGFNALDAWRAGAGFGPSDFSPVVAGHAYAAPPDAEGAGGHTRRMRPLGGPMSVSFDVTFAGSRVEVGLFVSDAVDQAGTATGFAVRVFDSVAHDGPAVDVVAYPGGEPVVAATHAPTLEGGTHRVEVRRRADGWALWLDGDLLGEVQGPHPAPVHFDRVATWLTAGDSTLDRLLVVEDRDGDGVLDALDNCPDVANPLQEDTDGNGRGSACDDADLDGTEDDEDPCPRWRVDDAEACALGGAAIVVTFESPTGAATWAIEPATGVRRRLAPAGPDTGAASVHFESGELTYERDGEVVARGCSVAGRGEPRWQRNRLVYTEAQTQVYTNSPDCLQESPVDLGGGADDRYRVFPTRDGEAASLVRFGGAFPTVERVDRAWASTHDEALPVNASAAPPWADAHPDPERVAFLVAAPEYGVKVVDLDGRHEVSPVPAHAAVHSPDGAYALVIEAADESLALVAYDVADGTRVAELVPPGEGLRPETLALFTPPDAAFVDDDRNGEADDFRRCATGVPWSPARVVSRTELDPDMPDLAWSGYDLGVVWRQFAGRQLDARFARATAGAETFGAPHALESLGIDDLFNPVPALLHPPRVAWADPGWVTTWSVTNMQGIDPGRWGAQYAPRLDDGSPAGARISMPTNSSGPDIAVSAGRVGVVTARDGARLFLGPEFAHQDALPVLAYGSGEDNARLISYEGGLAAVYPFWNGGLRVREIKVQRLADGEDAIGDPTFVGRGDSESMPQGVDAVAHGERIFATWHVHPDGRVMVGVDDPANDPVAAVHVNPGGAPGHDPAIAWADGALVVVWVADTEAGGELRMRVLGADLTPLTDAFRVSPPGVSPATPAMVQAGDRTALVWADAREGMPRTLYLRTGPYACP